MSLTYVIPDLHGRSDLLQDGLALIAAHARGGYGSLIALGDYVNKGPDSKTVIQLLRADPLPGWPFIPLRGNHDAMMVEALRDPQKMQGWLDRGGDATLAELFKAERARFGGLLNPTKIQAHCPPLLRAAKQLGAAIEQSGQLAKSLVALVSLRTASINGCPF